MRGEFVSLSVVFMVIGLKGEGGRDTKERERAKVFSFPFRSHAAFNGRLLFCCALLPRRRDKLCIKISPDNRRSPRGEYITIKSWPLRGLSFERRDKFTVYSVV